MPLRIEISGAFTAKFNTPGNSLPRCIARHFARAPKLPKLPKHAATCEATRVACPGSRALFAGIVNDYSNSMR